MKRKHFNIGLIIFFILFSFVLPKFFSNDRALYEIFKNENLPSKAKGKIKEIVRYKGGGITLIIYDDEGGRSEIAVSSEFGEIVKKRDIFVKEANSNKCFIERKDSLIYLDCYNDIPSEFRDSLGHIKEWPREIVGKWQLKNNE